MVYPRLVSFCDVRDSTLLVAMLSLNMFEHVPGVPCLIATIAMGASKWGKSYYYQPYDDNNHDPCDNLTLHANLLLVFLVLF